MLNLGFFRSARFSVGTAAVSVAFFALLGAIFALTQYLQFAHGYSAIEAGAIMSPIALGLMMGAGSSSKAVRRLGTSRVVAAGLSGLALLLALTTLWSPSTNALVLAAWFFGLALAMGWVMAPATEAVIGAVPAAKTGVASATNTVARMVSGALGVAVVGSLVSSLYSADVEGSLDALPAEAQAAAESSVGAASAIAAQLPPNAASALLATTGDAFTQAMGTGLLVAAALAGAMAVIVLRFLPPREPVEAESHEPRPSPHPQQARSHQPDGRPAYWMILVALVLGAAYLASRPGSDMPAANGQAVRTEVRGDRAFRSRRDGGAADPRTRARDRRERPDHLPPRLRQGGRLRTTGDAADALHHRLAQQVVHRDWRSCNSSRQGRSSSTRRCSATCPGSASRTRQLPRVITVRHLLNQTSGLSTKTGRTFQGNGDTSDAALEKDGSQAEQRRADGAGRQDASVQHGQLLGARADRADGRRTLLRELRPDGDPRPAADARLVHVRGGGRAPRPRDRPPLLVRPAESGRPPVQPRARPGRLPDLRAPRT